LFWWQGSDLLAQVAIGIRKAGPASPAGVEEPSHQARRGDRIPPSPPSCFLQLVLPSHRLSQSVDLIAIFRSSAYQSDHASPESSGHRPRRDCNFHWTS